MARAPKELFALALALLVSALVAVPASGSAGDVIRDCSEDGVLNGHYSHSELAKALDKLPSDLDEYTDCRAVIRSAELRSANKHKGRGVPGTVDTVSPPSAAEQRRLRDATRGAGSVDVGGRGITPGASAAPFKTAGLGTDLPPLVLAVLIALAGAMLAAATLAIRRHAPAFARVRGQLAGPGRLPSRFAKWVKDGVARLRR